MPSSRPNTIPIVIHLLRQLKPQSILDVGVGFGKWGHLFREYTDINEAEHDPARYQRENWRVRIDGIEGHAAYLTPMHAFLYNKLHVGDAAALIHALPRYDLIFLGDVIEHFEKVAGFELLEAACGRANKAVIVSTPRFETEQEDLCGNELERHRSLWAEEDFKAFDGAQVVTVDETTLLAVIARPGVPPLTLTAPRVPDLNSALHLARTRRALVELVPFDEPFILVDEEQFRPFLQHRRTIPFMEKDGGYWGPPPDDASAIRELERLRGEGARQIVFAWPSFWWLEHYAGFARYLRSNYQVLREDSLLVAFALASGTG
jgi:hypothetical protein